MSGKQLTPKEIRMILCAARKHARLEGYGHLKDDFASYYLERMLRGRKANPAKIFIDFKKFEYGDTRDRPHLGTKKIRKNPRTLGALRAEANLNMISLSVEEMKESGFKNASSPCKVMEYREQIEFIRGVAKAAKFNRQERVAFDSRFWEGRSATEIGKKLGVNVQKVDRIWAEVKRKLKSVILALGGEG